MTRWRLMAAATAFGVCLPGVLAGQTEPPLPRAVAQLRHAIGDWDVTTSFLNLDGSVARAVKGTYHFEWVVQDRVVSGHSAIPELSQRSGLLFYVSEARSVIEMVSVGAEGQLWVMTGALGEEVRTTPPVKGADGRDVQLRFTRFAVTPDGFESRMEYSHDAGKTWQPGNHQVFVRRPRGAGGDTANGSGRSG